MAMFSGTPSCVRIHLLAVANALMDFYAKCDDVKAAHRIFYVTDRRDLISWNSILDAFAGRSEAQFVHNHHRDIRDFL
ncbi:unnamed protein product [Linum trigynum]|uniref:Uncharacterized protein n=1 Tax=Linum trigynum TaxID=586398 RepID=A0AAV2D3J2_9ROSI